MKRLTGWAWSRRSSLLAWVAKVLPPAWRWTIGFVVTCFAVGGFLGWVLWPGTPELPDYGWHDSSTTDYDPFSGKCAPKSIGKIQSAAGAALRREFCDERAEQYRIQQQALVQSTRSADAAVQSVWVASWQSKATVFGLIVAFLTLAAAAIAAYFAKRAADEAKRSADASRDAIRIETTPHLQVTVINGRTVRHQNGKRGLFYPDGSSVELSVKAVGRGDARLLRMYRRWVEYAGIQLPPIPTYPPDPPGSWDETIDLVLGNEPISVASYSEQITVKRDDSTVVLYGWVEYADTTDSPRTYVTSFCFGYLPHTPTRGMVAGWFGPMGRDYWFHRDVTDLVSGNEQKENDQQHNAN